MVKDKPMYQGPLQLMAGPERVETGWWPECAGSSNDLTLRDYFIASSEMAGLLWIYRQRTGLTQPSAVGTAQIGWYLHGIYG